MLYVVVVLVGAFLAAAATRELPQRRWRIALVAIGVAAIAVAIAVPTGNLLLFYVGGGALWFCLFLLVIALVDHLRRRVQPPRFPGEY
jgi:peptidoglycan/LPS O-acetylase OafA/YrhL